MKPNIRIICLAQHLFNNPNGLTLQELFFFLKTRSLNVDESLFDQDLEQMKLLGLNLRFEGNKIILTNETLPDLWNLDSPID
jgi:hypothetical protein